MTRQVASLRSRLLILILAPLMLIALAAGVWRYIDARDKAETLFDRTLAALTLAISRDVVISGGDALSPSTLQLMREASGGEVFYHGRGPDGSFVTGYAYPPVGDGGARGEGPVFSEASYRGEAVRVSQLSEYVALDDVSGYLVVTVWQRMAARETLARELAMKSALLMISLIATVALVVWFGIKLGLRPLEDLQDAIAQRSSDELTEIRRPIPREVSGVVDTLNGLLGQVSRAMAVRDRFISDAAHQLRNPVAGILSMSEAVRGAPSEEAMRARADELVDAAKHTSRLTQQLLSLERVRDEGNQLRFTEADLNEIARTVCARNAGRILKQGLAFEFEEGPEPIPVLADAVMLGEAVENLIDNALVHGGSKNESITVAVSERNRDARVTVADSGAGLNQGDREAVFERFSQIRPGEGSGLGLAIVREIAHQHGGTVGMDSSECGASFTITLRKSSPQ